MNDESSNLRLPESVLARLRPQSRAARITVLTGAGSSAESGIPTFRDAPNSLWSDFSPEELATPGAWRRDPAKVWAWYEWRRHVVMAAAPHVGHQALADLELKFDVTVLTQNVDDLHERAGSTKVLHLHGSLFAPHCFACRRPGRFDDNSSSTEPLPLARLEPPRCKHCGGKLRPGVVWFGEALPEQERRAALAAVLNADLLLVVGTSGTVQPVARLPGMAIGAGVPVLEINPQPVFGTEDQRVICWPSPAAHALVALREQLL